MVKDILLRFGQWFLALMNLVSISLPVSTEMVKFCQAKMMELDILMIQETKEEDGSLTYGESCNVNSSNLNEELGCINYIFTDKTGTLTQNIMDFKEFIAGDVVYGTRTEANKFLKMKSKKDITNVNFLDDDGKFKRDSENSTEQNHEYLNQFVQILALCHSVVITKEEERISYQAASPDEMALINGARYLGTMYKKKEREDGNFCCTIEKNSIESKYSILLEIEFTSTRKRSTVVVQNVDTKEIIVMTKGADSIIEPLLKSGQEKVKVATRKYLEECANIGLRTLMLARRVMT